VSIATRSTREWGRSASRTGDEGVVVVIYLFEKQSATNHPKLSLTISLIGTLAPHASVGSRSTTCRAGDPPSRRPCRPTTPS